MSAVPPDSPPHASSAEIEKQEPTASNTGRKFPCPGCGAKLDFDPGNRALKCPFCGYAEQIDPSAEGVRERDWEEYWQNANSHTATIAGRSSEVQCKACAAVVLLEDKVVTDKCPYCGNDLENKPVSAESMILPEGILPFKVDLKRAKNSFKQWIEARWFAPSDLKRMADLGQLNGIYVPFWTFDSMTYTHYRGERGDDYQEIETYVDHETRTSTDAQGNTTTQTVPVTKTRTVTKTRWSSVSGNVDHFFDDVLVCASHSLPDDLMNDLAPWDLQNYEPFRPEFLAGFQTERYTVGLKEGFGSAQGIMEGTIRSLCCQDIGGDHQRLHSVQTQHSAITFKHVLQPVWLAPYRYHQQLYRIAINARTGEVVGTRPYSYWKIFLLVLAILVTIGIGALIAGVGNSMHGQVVPPGQPSRDLPAEMPLPQGAGAFVLPGRWNEGLQCGLSWFASEAQMGKRRSPPLSKGGQGGWGSTSLDVAAIWTHRQSTSAPDPLRHPLAKGERNASLPRLLNSCTTARGEGESAFRCEVSQLLKPTA